MSGLFGGSKAPAPPDYAAAAKEQGRANLEAIRTGAALNRVDQITPYGTVRYRQVPGTASSPTTPTPTGTFGGGTPSPGSWLSPGTGGYGSLADILSGWSPQGTPQQGATNSDHWEQITELSPDQQAILDTQEGNQIDMGRIAGQRLNQFGDMGPLNFSGQPSRVSGVSPANFRTDVSSPGVRYQDLDLAGLAGIPGADDFGAERQRVEDALYGRATTNLDPQFQQREEAMRTRLINSGNVEGSEAWKNEMGNFERERQGAYDQARNSAILAGGTEQSRMLADALSSREQQFGERLYQGQFGNQASKQALDAELAKTGLYNAAESDRFAQGVTNANLTNSARDAGINEQIMLRDRPLQEFLQLFGGSSGSGFNAPAVPQAGTPTPEDIMGATQAGYEGKIGQWNANQAQSSQNTNALLSLAGILAMSDRRAKRDIERIGTLPNGLPTYRFKYLNDDTLRTGVMSDEVREVFPDAVVRGFDGYDRVNYTTIGAEHLLETR